MRAVELRCDGIVLPGRLHKLTVAHEARQALAARATATHAAEQEVGWDDDESVGDTPHVPSPPPPSVSAPRKVSVTLTFTRMRVITYRSGAASTMPLSRLVGQSQSSLLDYPPNKEREGPGETCEPMQKHLMGTWIRPSRHVWHGEL